jgi:uridylate kinase
MALPLSTIDWKAFRKIVGNRWDPGANVPFDPVAAKMAERIGLTVKMIEGRSFGEIAKALDGQDFKGTVIG